jgi:flagellar hook-associated protein 1
MSTFSGLNVGLSSLFAQRRGLETTGHNVANANTDGYSRQRVRLQGSGGPVALAIHSRWNGVGNGVTVADTQRLRDAFLESRSVQERGSEAHLRGQQVTLSRVEAIFAEPGDSALQSQLSDFWSGWDDVANQPTDLAARSQLLERAKTLADGVNRASERLEAQWNASYEQLQATVSEVNGIAASVADFNKAIMAATKAGVPAHDLADQRDLLVQRLGELVGVTLRPGSAGEVNVSLGGTALVQGSSAERLAVPRGDTMDAGAPVQLTWDSTGADRPVAGVGGAAAGLVSALNDVLPRYQNGLHALAGQLADDVNAVHQAGYDQGGRPGGDFFSFAAGRLGVLVTAPADVAASDAPSASGDRNGGNAATLAELAGRAGGVDERYRQLIVSLGVEAQATNRRVDIQADILRQVDTARESEAGVNLDEEMTSMLAYQRGYEGAARFLTAVDQMLDTLINRTGLVGR